MPPSISKSRWSDNSVTLYWQVEFKHSYRVGMRRSQNHMPTGHLDYRYLYTVSTVRKRRPNDFNLISDSSSRNRFSSGNPYQIHLDEFSARTLSFLVNYRMKTLPKYFDWRFNKCCLFCRAKWVVLSVKSPYSQNRTRRIVLAECLTFYLYILSNAVE